MLNGSVAKNVRPETSELRAMHVPLATNARHVMIDLRATSVLQRAKFVLRAKNARLAMLGLLRKHVLLVMHARLVMHASGATSSLPATNVPRVMRVRLAIPRAPVIPFTTTRRPPLRVALAKERVIATLVPSTVQKLDATPPELATTPHAALGPSALLRALATTPRASLGRTALFRAHRSVRHRRKSAA